MGIDELTYKVRGCIFEVFKEPGPGLLAGPGLLESVYEAALLFELQNANLVVLTQIGVPVVYKSIQLELGFRLDLLVETR